MTTLFLCARRELLVCDEERNTFETAFNRSAAEPDMSNKEAEGACMRWRAMEPKWCGMERVCDGVCVMVCDVCACMCVMMRVMFVHVLLHGDVHMHQRGGQMVRARHSRSGSSALLAARRRCAAGLLVLVAVGLVRLADVGVQANGRTAKLRGQRAAGTGGARHSARGGLSAHGCEAAAPRLPRPVERERRTER